MKVIYEYIQDCFAPFSKIGLGCFLFVIFGYGGVFGFDVFEEIDVTEIYTSEEYLPLMDVNRAKMTLQELNRTYESTKLSYEKIAELQSMIDEQYKDTKLAFIAIMSSVKKHTTDLGKKRTRLAVLIAKIRTLSELTQEMKGDVDDSKLAIQQYLQFLFKVQNDFYSDDRLETIKALARSENISTIIGKEQIVTIIIKKLDDLYNDLISKYTQYNDHIKQLQNLAAEYDSIIENHKNEISKLEEQYSNVSELAEYLKKDQSFLLDEVERIQTAKEGLENQIKDIKTVIDPLSIRSVKQASQNVIQLLHERDRQDGSRYFSWPVHDVSELFDQSAEDGTLSIRARQGEELYSSAPGLVYKVNRSSDLSLSWVVVIHKYGYVTIIEPLSSVFVKEGDVLKRGDIIGLVGGEPGTTGAGLESKQSHVTFQLLKNSKPFDPHLVLDLGVFRSESQIDPMYSLKRQQDLVARKIDVTGSVPLRGESIEQRRNDFLSQFGGPIFGDPNIRLSAAKGTGIDPNFGICIGSAETSYRNFKSSNNIGNVGNDDSGNTRSFSTPEDGVRALFNVLNNRYLGGYTTMDQLSRFGNQHSYIYASSSYNWQKNIMNCLSSIYDMNVPEDYFFRVVK